MEALAKLNISKTQGKKCFKHQRVLYVRHVRSSGVLTALR